VLDIIDEDPSDPQLITFSIANPESPVEVNRMATSVYAQWAFYRIDDWLYIISGTGIRVISISDPENPEDIGYVRIPEFGIETGRPCGERDIMYVNTRSGLATVSFEDRRSPILIDLEQDSIPPYDMLLGTPQFDDDYVYVPATYALFIYRREDDGTLTLHHTFYEGLGFISFEIYGDYGYTYLRGYGALIVKFNEDRTSIEAIDPFERLEARFGPYLRRGEYLFSGSDTTGLLIHYLGDPEHPYLVGRYDNPGILADISVNMDSQIMAVADRYAFELYDFSDALSIPASSQLLLADEFRFSAFPNPFNSSTTISYSLPSPGRYAIDVIDIQGRLVTRLSDGWREAGSYRQVLNGDYYSTGSYFIKLNSQDRTSIALITLNK